MVAARQQTLPGRSAASGALATARRRVSAGRPQDTAVLSLQRAAGNAAVSALMAARLRWPGEAAVKDIDGAMREFRKDEPAVEPVERGLKAAKAAGIPVDLEGIRPPPSALAVVTTGFGPGNVPAKKPVPPPKRTPAVSPLGRAAARKGSVGRVAVPSRPAPAGGGGAASATAGPVALGADQLLQPPVSPVPVRPEADPAFTRVTGTVKATARQKRSHPPAGAKAKEAQDAALPPAGDVGSQAKAAKTDTMDAQRPGTFDKKAFIAAVKAAIEAKSPKTLKEAAAPNGKVGDVKAEVKSLVTEGEKGQAADIKAATDAPPDQSKAVAKPVTPMVTESPGAAAPIPATGAVPKPAPPEQLNLAAGPHGVNAEMAADGVSEKQLAESNEPQFQEALSNKKAAAAHADTAPGEYRQQEQQVIAQGKSEATAESAAGAAGMQGSHGMALAQLVAAKGKTKTKDEAKRAEVTGRIEQIFTTTETDVKKILDGIDPKVEKQFDAGEAIARRAFETYVRAKMSAYKRDRYGGWTGGLRWAKDKLFGMPDKVNEFYVAGRELYLKEMDNTISRVADTVGNDLNAAKTRIAKGRLEIADYVKSLPKDLKRVGADASKEIGDRFEQLEGDVDAKSEALVDTLATKYVEARKGLDERIEELQAENKGLVDKAIGAIKAVINTIRELVGMLTNALARAASVIGDIISAPVKFLGNLIAGVKGGILKFKDDFLGHLRRGLMSWLFGALAEGGVEPPKSFDLKGIVGFLASLFGLTWANIRSRIVLRIGEKAMGAVEKGVEVFKIMSGPEGVGGLWQMLMDKLGDIKEMIFEQVKDFVQDRIISAGISWLIGLLNPVGAFIKACKLIYDIVMFFVDNAARIAKFVSTVLDSVVDVVRGNISGVVNKVNDALGQMVPIIIGFLASLVNLGGVGQKVREIIKKLQKPVTKAIDFLISTGLKLAAPIIRGIAGISKKVKAKVAAGKAWVKGKAEAGKKWVKGKAEAGKKRGNGEERGKGSGPASPHTAGKNAVAAGAVSVKPAPFSMDGAGHALSVVEVGGSARIMMASDPRELVAKIGKALESKGPAGEPHGGLPDQVVTNLRGMSNQITAFQNGMIEMVALYKLPTNAGIELKCAFLNNRWLKYPQFLEAVSTRLAKWADELEQVGAIFHLKDLQHVGHRSRFVDGNSLKEEWRRTWRDTFYGGFIAGAGKAIRRNAIDTGLAYWRGVNPGATMPARFDLYQCAHCKDWFSSAGAVPGFESRGLQVDHDETVVQQWLREGRNATQDKRVAWNSTTANLQPMCQVCNGGGNPKLEGDFTVGVGFRGPSDAPPSSGE